MNIFGILLLVGSALSVDLDVDSVDSIREATALISTGLMDYYWGYQKGGTIGMFTNPYYWWEAGGAWGSMIDYWYFLENNTYEETIKQALLYQVGENDDYIPLNQSTTEGNDDQAFWGIAAIQAAERNFTNPSDDQPQWLYLAQAVFNTMAWRWDTDSCNGGLRWQIFPWNSGYDYKNSVSNAGLFHIGARLARFTGNDSYVDWAEKVYDWLVGVKFVNESNSYYFAYDGANIDDNCSSVTKYQWTYNAGMLLSGCAYLYNYTGEDIWKERTLGYLNGLFVFTPQDGNYILQETACQGSGTCNNDQRSFKAYLSRFLGLTAVLVPETQDTVNKYLQDSAQGAAASCSGGYDGHTCGLNWNYNGWDGNYGLGEQMCALEVMQNLLIYDRPAPYTATNGGSSTGDGAAGSQTTSLTDQPLSLDKGDSAGAAIITVLIGVSIIALACWLLV
ncbi:hypothetical protein OGAPHI_007161 [Ogataea philodendri]|uniref:Mannan endo-1,6-alpha-mannosidase n=1 Tax=Ogataea philodendri TaxID=1378263 RepID=A0A9P8T071_9ASCO|nr:uncharacterized protein OGAPHI_007161 [Ogataea philodendri]KAH3660575.1 hypothetical protein OGAPHI_007161 [Ogataea philodendri]